MEITSIDPSQLSSAMRQFYDIKMQHLDKVVFFQMGDFFEMFFEDAIYMSKVCDLALTCKSAGLKEKIPMAGVPLNNVNDYIKMVLSDNKKVVIVEQGKMSEDKVITRFVSKIVTPANFLDEVGYHKYVGAIAKSLDNIYFSYGDITTGELFHITNNDEEVIINEILNNNFVELLVINDSLNEEQLSLYVGEVIPITDLSVMGLDSVDQVLLKYISDLTCHHDSYLSTFTNVDFGHYMHLTPNTTYALELVRSMHGDEHLTLYHYLNYCKTAMGRRNLKELIIHPFTDQKIIEQRLDIVEQLVDNYRLVSQLQELLVHVYDIERILGQISDHSIGPKGVVQLRQSLRYLTRVREVLTLEPEPLKTLVDDIFDIALLLNYLDLMVKQEPNFSLKEGGVINDGVDQELDELRNLSNNSNQWFNKYEEEQQRLTGCDKLKIKYNRLTGYYMEMPNSVANMALDTYTVKQKLTNVTRFVTDELAEVDAKLKSACDRIIELEQNVFEQVRDNLELAISVIRCYAKFASNVDVYQSLATTSYQHQLVRPTFNDRGIIEIKDGYHPIIKGLVDNYIVNDTYFDQEVSTMLITGPNMSGKSTYMRQTALIIIMAQLGCFVPASKAILSIIDKVFTRIGASDNTMHGQSTFMVEMMESSEALKNATQHSLILFDELGRGTSTYDGMSIAASILEYISNNIKCPTMFSTHYHELIDLEASNPRIKNFHVSATEENGDLVFLHKVQKGGVANSFGIEVAKLAKLPTSIINRAKDYLNYFSHEQNNNDNPLPKVEETSQEVVNNAFESDIIEDISKIDINNLSPIEVQHKLYEIQKLIKEHNED